MLSRRNSPNEGVGPHAPTCTAFQQRQCANHLLPPHCTFSPVLSSLPFTYLLSPSPPTGMKTVPSWRCQTRLESVRSSATWLNFWKTCVPICVCESVDGRSVLDSHPVRDLDQRVRYGRTLGLVLAIWYEHAFFSGCGRWICTPGSLSGCSRYKFSNVMMNFSICRWGEWSFSGLAFLFK